MKIFFVLSLFFILAVGAISIFFKNIGSNNTSNILRTDSAIESRHGYSIPIFSWYPRPNPETVIILVHGTTSTENPNSIDGAKKSPFQFNAIDYYEMGWGVVAPAYKEEQVIFTLEPVDDIVDVVRHLKDQGVENIVVVGLSLGGIIVPHVISEEPVTAAVAGSAQFNVGYFYEMCKDGTANQDQVYGACNFKLNKFEEYCGGKPENKPTCWYETLSSHDDIMLSPLLVLTGSKDDQSFINQYSLIKSLNKKNVQSVLVESGHMVFDQQNNANIVIPFIVDNLE